MNKIYLGLLHITHLRIGVVSFWVALLTLSLSICGFFLQLPSSLELGFFVLLMALLGIPHGATDHIVFFTSTTQPTQGTKSMYFFRFYLGTMLAYALAWWIFPYLCFVAFLVFSAYHFGQSQLYYLALPEKSWIKGLLYFTWGSIVLLSILGFNTEETIQMMEETPFLPLIENLMDFFAPLLIANGLALLFCLIWVYFHTKISLLSILQELCLLALIMFLAWSSSILLSFAIYFSLWHSLQTIEQEMKVFQAKLKRPYRWKNYVQDALPFSMISFVGIGFLLTIVSIFKPSESHLLFAFFVMISILTAPHALLIHRIYQEKE